MQATDQPNNRAIGEIRILILMIPILMIGIFAGCRHALNKSLLEAESVIETSPMKALEILDSIPKNSISGKEELALYNLLLTQARIKNKEYPGNDSLISISANYYRDGNKPERLLKAEYYLGVTNQHTGNFPGALTNFYKALELADTLKDNFYAGMACRGISTIYSLSLMRKDAADFAERQLSYMRKAGRQPYLDYAMLAAAIALCNARSTDKSMELCRQLRDSVRLHDNPHLEINAMSTEAVNLIWENKYLEALPILREVCASQLSESSDSLRYCLTLIQTGNLSEADRLFSNITGGDDSQKSQIRALLAMENKDYQTAFKEVMRTDSLVSEKFNKAMGQNLGTAAYNYNEAETALHHYEIKLSRIKLMLTIGVAAVLLLILTGLLILYIYKRRRYKEIIKNWEAEVANLLAASDNSKLQENEQLISQLFKNKVRLIRQLKNLTSTEENTENEVEFNEQAALLIKEMRDKPGELELEVNHVFNDIMAKFRHDLPGMKEENYHLFLYSLLGVPTEAIMVMMKNSHQQVSSRRKRIREKIKQLPQSKQELYLSILGQ